MSGIKNDFNNSNIIYIIISALLLFSVLKCGQESTVQNKNEESTNEIGIIITENTVMRLDPIIYSAVVTYICKGEKVKILKKSTVKSWLGDISDYWYMVRYSKGFLGWIYGKNIKIFFENDAGKISKYLSRFWKKELIRTRSRIKGLWEIIKTGGSNPGQHLLIYDDGNYVSYLSENELIKGQYKINLKDGEILFSDGTFFGKKIMYSIRERRLYLILKNGDKETVFKRITRKIDNIEPGKGTGDQSTEEE